MSKTHRKYIGFRDSDTIIQYLDEKAQAKGIDRSDVLRMLVREKQAAETDSK